jgi:pantothenate kinase, type III
MILAVDIGNTNVVIGVIDEDKIHFIERVATIKTKTEAEYAIDFKILLDLHKIDLQDITGGIVSSVVPQITKMVQIATEKVIEKKVLVLGPGIKTGLNILIDNPAQLGSDLVAGSVASITEYQVPTAIVDMGTATTVAVIDQNKNYIGGMIVPGVQVALESLTMRASQLQGISLEAPKKVIGKNTIDCMTSGVIYSNADIIDGLIDRVEVELGKKVTVVATGGLAKMIIPHCRHEIILDEDLLLKGLFIIYNKNK